MRPYCNNITLWQNSIAIGDICNLYFRNLNFKKVPNDWQLSRANINLSVPLDQIYFSCEGRFYQLGQIELQLLNILSHWFEHGKGAQNVIKKPKKIFIYINNIQGLKRKSGDRKVHHGSRNPLGTQLQPCHWSKFQQHCPPIGGLSPVWPLTLAFWTHDLCVGACSSSDEAILITLKY